MLKEYLLTHKDIFTKSLFWADQDIGWAFSSASIWNFSFKHTAKVENIIDLGCGPGTLLTNLSKNANSHVIGIDLSREKLIYASKMAANASVVRADVLNLPFPDNTFGIVFSSQLIEHVDDNKMIKEVNRILKPKGLFALGTVFRKGKLYPQNVEHLREYTNEQQLTAPLQKNGSEPLFFEITPVKYSGLDRLFRLMYSFSHSNVLIELPKQKVFVLLRSCTKMKIPTFYHLEILARKK